MQFSRHDVESDLFNLGCDKNSALSVSTAIAGIVRDADDRRLDYVISYEANEYYLAVDILHYRSRRSQPPQIGRGQGYVMAKSIVKEISVIPNMPRNGFTVRIIDEKRRPRVGEIV